MNDRIGADSSNSAFDPESRCDVAESSSTQARYEDAVRTVIAMRESIAVRDQKNAALERELRAALQRLDDANAAIERAAATANEIQTQLQQRDARIDTLAQQCAENAETLKLVSQDIARLGSGPVRERLTMMDYALESLDHAGTVHRINRATTTVGRAGTNDISIDSSSVSRYHARIVVQPEGVWLIDMQSTNGCAVNGQRIERHVLCDGDAVTIGHCKFRFSSLNAAALDHPADDAPILNEPVVLSAPRPCIDGSRHQRH